MPYCDSSILDKTFVFTPYCTPSSKSQLGPSFIVKSVDNCKTQQEKALVRVQVDIVEQAASSAPASYP